MNNKKIQIGICLWSIPQSGFSAVKMAHEIGYSGIVLELGKAAERFPMSQKDQQKRFLEEAQKYHMQFPTLAINEFCRTAMTKVENYERVKEILNIAVETACAMGVKLLQLPNFGNGFIKTEEDFMNTAKCLQYACKTARSTALTVGTENGLTAEDNIKMLKVVGEPNLKIYFDTANPLCLAEGMYAPAMLEEMKDFVCEVHLKDVAYDKTINRYQFVPLGQGDVHMFESIHILKRNHYTGWVHNENEYSIDLLKQDAVNIQSAFAD